MKELIIGRKQQQNKLQDLYESEYAEFLVVYGRRRTGKTFLVREYFEGKFSFYHTALSPYEMLDNAELLLEQQLKKFGDTLRSYGSLCSGTPKDWFEAFDWLRDLLSKKSSKKRLVVFIDELPWLDTPRSNFITAFEHFWNGWGAGRHNLLLIVCGSATSWIANKLLNNTGGLYGRSTYEMQILPFSLRECELFYKKRGLVLDRYDQLQAYMITGGIPYYLGFFRKGLSLGQNIDQLFFVKTAKLKKEFERLFASLFPKPTNYRKIIGLLATRHKGFTRDEITKATGIQKGGGLSKMLAALEASDFISRYVPFGVSKREEHYKLTDNFCLFHEKFLAGNEITDTDFWEKNQNSQKLSAWKGIAFEEVCLAHIQQIKNALGIGAITSRESAWSIKGDKENDGTQIDLLIDRDDNIVNLCEMKFLKDKFTINKSYDEKLRSRTQMLIDRLPKRATVHLTLITSYGLKYNEYSGEIQKLLTLDSLFTE